MLKTFNIFIDFSAPLRPVVPGVLWTQNRRAKSIAFQVRGVCKFRLERFLEWAYCCCCSEYRPEPNRMSDVYWGAGFYVHVLRNLFQFNELLSAISMCAGDGGVVGACEWPVVARVHLGFRWVFLFLILSSLLLPMLIECNEPREGAGFVRLMSLMNKSICGDVWWERGK